MSAKGSMTIWGNLANGVPRSNIPPSSEGGLVFPTRQEYRSAWSSADKADFSVPLNLDIELAAACNARCPFCLYGDKDWAQSMAEPDWDGHAKRRFMPKSMALLLIEEAAEMGIPAIKLNFRGESTLHPDFTAIARRARRMQDWRKNRMVSGFYDILLNTNGNCPAKALDGLMYCTRVTVSLDTMDEAIYEKVRPGLSIEEAWGTIDWMVSKGHRGIMVRRVVCKENREEDFKKAVLARWAKGVRVSEHHAFDRNPCRQESTHGEDPKDWPRRFCGYPAQRIIVEASGRIQPCCVAWKGEFDCGVYPGVSLADYWKSPSRRMLVDELRRGVLQNPKCVACTSFAAYNRPEREALAE